MFERFMNWQISDAYVLHSDRIDLRRVWRLRAGAGDAGGSERGGHECSCVDAEPIALKRGVLLGIVGISEEIGRKEHIVVQNVLVDERPVESVLVVQREPRAPSRRVKHVWIQLTRLFQSPPNQNKSSH